MRSRSDRRRRTHPATIRDRTVSTRALVVAVVVLVAVAAPVSAVWAGVISTTIYLVAPGVVQREDVYVAASSARIDGTVDGDLVISTGSLVINGTVTGDVLVASHGVVTVAGSVDGSLRGAAREVRVVGSVGDDVAVVAPTLAVHGDVGRDVGGFGGRLVHSGTVERDVLGRFLTVTLGGSVGRDVHMAVGDLTMTGAASVGGDVVYRSGRPLVGEGDPSVGGQTVRVPARSSFFVSVVLGLARLLGFFGFVVGGIMLLWLLRHTGERAAGVVAERPWARIGTGLAAVVGGPIMLVVLIASLVGVPLAVVVLLAIVAGLLFGSVPLVTAVGKRMIGERGGALAGFVVGAAVWSVAAVVLPVLGAALYLVGVVWGTGGWLLGAWQVRDRLEEAAPGA